MINDKSKHKLNIRIKFCFDLVDKGRSVEYLYVIIFWYVFLYSPRLTHMGIWMVKFKRLRLKFQHLIQKYVPSLHEIIVCNIIFISYYAFWRFHMKITESNILTHIYCSYYTCYVICTPFMNTNRCKCVFHIL